MAENVNVICFKFSYSASGDSVETETKIVTHRSKFEYEYIRLANHGFWMNSDFQIVSDNSDDRKYWVPPSNILGIERVVLEE